MICALIPTYNNADTLSDVLSRTAKFIQDIIVVVDGSTDSTREVLKNSDIPLTIIDLPVNRGKGYALKTGLKKAKEMGFTQALTLDSDGQHLPEDIPLLLEAGRKQPDAFVIGSRNIEAENMPGKSTFANKFSNFWFAVQTGLRLNDTQTGMRIYPLQRLHGLGFLTSRYEAELELLVFAAWAGESIVSVPIHVYYPPAEKRVSHFRPAYDFTRISILNTLLCVLAFVYGWPRTLFRKLFFLFLITFSVCGFAKERIYPYPADSVNNTGIAVIVCPGGSYSWLDMPTEGRGVAQWLQQEGINAFVLRYRVATVSAYILGYRVLGIGNKYPDMQRDVETALRYVYSHAEEYGIDTARIGVMGFSAGGHLTMSSYVYNHTLYRPHFLCPVYPVVSMSHKVTHKRSRRGALGVWRQFNHAMRDSLSIEKHIPSDCPPVFLVNCKDDPVVDYRNSVLLDSALTAEHIEHRYIQYHTGGHGFGATARKTTSEAIQWKEEFIRWIKNLYSL